MIATRTPLRVSLVGGGTDFPEYYQENGGAVVSGTINKHVYVFINQRHDSKYRISYTQTEIVDDVNEITHDLIREVIKLHPRCHPVEVVTMADIPGTGTGLGSSGAVTVGALLAMMRYTGANYVHPSILAERSTDIEMVRLKKPIGLQDQTASAYGGFNFIRFTGTGTEVKPLPHGRLLERNLMLFFTGTSRQSSALLTEQKQADIQLFHELHKLAYDMKGAIEGVNLDEVGRIMHEGWKVKRQMGGRISNGEIDDMYAKARKAGATGGKICGAGGGGYLLLYAPYSKQKMVREVLTGYNELRFRFDYEGSKVIYEDE